ncbi:cytochrome ubiquinol oxidase subunit I [Streptomyces sp. NPDC056227]|uniref:cytochrome ubiquinol oxidase subunit I n=1 Tax=Streptomyces sp. NPDC056227 TaxID=3345753 RepID=UPI0035E2A507
MHTTVALLANAAAPPQLLPARQLMAFTLASHILLVPFGVALPFITLLMHHRGLRRGDEVALRLARRWSAVMAVQFAIGVVTGTVLSFEFGLLWPGMMGRWGETSSDSGSASRHGRSSWRPSSSRSTSTAGAG